MKPTAKKNAKKAISGKQKMSLKQAVMSHYEKAK